MKVSKTGSRNLVELTEYIATHGAKIDAGKLAGMIESLQQIIIEADDKLVSQNAIDTVFPDAQTLSPVQIEKLNRLLPWSTLVAYAGTLQGAPWDDKKRSHVHRIPDIHIEKTRQWIEGKRVLEIGCHDGVYTLGLAKYAAVVVALDGRIENVLKTLTRLWLANRLNKVRVVCYDLENLDVPCLSPADSDGHVFDLIHHNGVLYHLSNPLAHLDNILDNNPARVLFLDTHVAGEDQCRHTYHHGGVDFDVYKYTEPASRTYSPFAGITEQAVWLRMDDLVEYLRNKGFVRIEEKTVREERNGIRCRIICSRNTQAGN